VQNDVHAERRLRVAVRAVACGTEASRELPFRRIERARLAGCDHPTVGVSQRRVDAPTYLVAVLVFADEHRAEPLRGVVLVGCARLDAVREIVMMGVVSLDGGARCPAAAM
jgi:hypothetical protein